MPDTMICSFCKTEVSTALIACPHCGNHFNTEEGVNRAAEFHPTQRVQVPHRWLMLLACAILAVGALMPWGMMDSMLGNIVIKGSEGDGALIAIFAGVMFGVALLPERSSNSRRLIFIAGSVISGVILFPKLFWFIPDPELEGSGLSAQLYIGLVIAVIGVVIVLVSALITRPKNLPY